jgi:PBP1b-binding outer membrane lipoprotein LpoB
MRKLFALLAIILFLSLIVGCGSTDYKAQAQVNDTTTTVTQQAAENKMNVTIDDGLDSALQELDIVDSQ